MSSHPLVAQALDALKHENFAAARECMESYGRTNQLELLHYKIRALAELALHDWPAAQKTLTEATAQHQQDAQLWFNLGIAQENLGDFKNAAASFERSLTLKPDDADACGNLSNIYCRQGRFADAENMARRALALGAPKAQVFNSLGLALNRQNKFAEAEAAYQQALEQDAGDVFVLSNLANLAVDRLDFAQAWDLFARARKAGNDAPLIRHHEGMARLLSGDFEKGWPLYEARLQLPNALRVQPPCPRWNSENLAGKKLLIVAEQGFGDAIQFCRYGALLEKTGAGIIWLMPKNLQRLLAANLPGRVVTENENLPAADFYIPIVSLPLVLGLKKPEQSPKAPYLKAPDAPALPPAQAKTKIGLVWSGSPTHHRDFERSIPLGAFAPLWEKITAAFYAPFTGKILEQIADAPIARLDHLIGDFADTAAIISQLDCLVTVDTAVAHLAGALGVKTFLLLPYSPDWRWGTQGETTPWYPDLHLIRQSQPGDWQSAINQLIESLSVQM